MELPTLAVAGPVALISPDDRPVQTWPDARGLLRAASYRVYDAYWVDWPGVARFVVRADVPEVTAVPDDPADEEAVRDVFRRFITPLAWQLRGGEALHAAALCWGDSAVAFCAATGTGKSTFACALAARGHSLLTDDGLLLDPYSLPAAVRPAPTDGIRLRPESAAHFGLTAAGADRVVTVPGHARAASGLLRGVVILERVAAAAPLDIRRLHGGEALAAVLAHAHSIDSIDASLRARSVARYLAVLEAAPVWQLRYPSGYDRLPEAVDLVERTMEAFV